MYVESVYQRKCGKVYFFFFFCGGAMEFAAQTVWKLKPACSNAQGVRIAKIINIVNNNNKYNTPIPVCVQ